QRPWRIRLPPCLGCLSTTLSEIVSLVAFLFCFRGFLTAGVALDLKAMQRVCHFVASRVDGGLDNDLSSESRLIVQRMFLSTERKQELPGDGSPGATVSYAKHGCPGGMCRFPLWYQ